MNFAIGIIVGAILLVGIVAYLFLRGGPLIK